MMHAIKSSTDPTYIRDIVTVVNEISGRSYLRSDTLGHFDVPITRTKLGSKPFQSRVLLDGTVFQRTFEQLQKSTYDTFISSRIRTCCLILFYFLIMLCTFKL